MNGETLKYLQSEAARALLEAHLSDDPQAFALQMAQKGHPAAALATQLKMLQKASKKLPTWYAHQAILPPRAFEQCSSELAARLKFGQRGKRALDLTCGLGVDSHALAQRYDTVVALEANPGLAAVTTANFAAMHVDNVDVRNTSAESFLAAYDGPSFDLVFVDPDRRDKAGNRKFLLRDCQPDVVALLPRLRACARRILVKASPLLDVAATEVPAERITVLSIDGEVKEVLLQIGQQDAEAPEVGVRFFRENQLHEFHTRDLAAKVIPAMPEAISFVYEADPALYKARLFPQWWQARYPEVPVQFNHAEGYAFAQARLPDFPGRRFEVREALPYKPAVLKKRLKGRAMQLSRRNFDVPLAAVRKKLGIKEGGTDYLLLTRDPTGKRRAMFANRF